MIDRDTLRRRLFLCLFALGTNIGIRQLVATGEHGETEAALRHVRRHYVTRDNLRRAVARLVNVTFEVRDQRWWGAGTTCASDSKKFGSWESNLMTEWHARYGGPGVMIYWHVERKSACIYSQLKSCSSSEVAAMIEGLLRHCTDAEIEANYVDSHGASIIGFAFCELLGFRLLPRLKRIGSVRLYRVALGMGQNRLMTGAAGLHLVDGVSLLRPEEQVFAAMLDGWRNQQLARNLAFSTINGREKVVEAFARHADAFPWAWTAQMVDEWLGDLRAVHHLKRSTWPPRSDPSGPGSGRSDQPPQGHPRPVRTVEQETLRPVRPTPLRPPAMAGRPGVLDLPRPSATRTRRLPRLWAGPGTARSRPVKILRRWFPSAAGGPRR